MTPTMTMRPTHVASFDKMANLHSTAEDVMDERRPRHPARPSTAGAASTPSAYPMYPGLQTSSTDRLRCRDGAVPFVLNRPRKLSGNNNYNNNTTPFDHIPSPDGRLHGHMGGYRPRSSSYGNGAPRYDDLDAYPHLWRRPNYGPPSTTTAAAPALRKMKSRAKLGDMISTLPGEVLDVILEMLKDLHLGRGGESCATCWMRDVCSVALCSRKWSKPARLALYHDIQLIGPDSATHKKKFKMAQGSRMMLLRRTLRANDEIATLVRSLRVPAAEGPFHGKGAAAALEQYENNVAALVMACPNLERLSGPDLAYEHSFRRLFHALSTRTNLKDMDWLIDPSGPLSGGGGGNSSSSSSSASSSKECVVSDHGALQTHEESAFLELHRDWSRLTSLSVQCRGEATLAPPTLLARTLTMLPSLQHLHLHNLPAAAFNDTNLLSLPPLQSLTLSNLGGITSNGLSAFATLPSSQPLRRLVLRHVPLTSLPALARILSNLGALGDVSLVQSFPPLMPASDDFVLWMMPYLASSSLRRLHWDITSHPDSANAADRILAQSIRAGGFPGLETLRAPNDPDGIFQQLCRPVERVDLPGDRYLTQRHHHSSSTSSTSTSLPSSPVAKRQLAKSPTSSSLPGLVPLPVPHTNLAAARLAAQARLEQARAKPLFRVDVTDEQGRLVDSFGLAGYVGTLGSPISYHLLPDRGSADDRGGLVDVPDLRAERAPGATGGCTGRWNWREDPDKKDKDRERSWWHTERGPWRRVSLAGRVV